jgi:hypothetical protein
MKKLTLGVLATFFVLSVIPTSLKAGTGSNPSETTEKSANLSYDANDDKLNEIKTIEMSALNTSGNKETLKEAGLVKNVQNEHGRKYRNRHQRENVDVVITSGRNDGYNNGRHGHSGAYVGIGGLCVIILIVLLII